MKNSWCYIVMLCMLVFATPSRADLIGENGYAVDTVTGLEWIDAQTTEGYSYDQIEGGAGGFLADGWQYATVSQWVDLMTRYVGPVIYPPPFSALNAASVSYFGSALSVVLTLGMTVGFDDPRAAYNIIWSPSEVEGNTEGILVAPDGSVSWAQVTAVENEPPGPFDSTYWGGWGYQDDYSPTLSRSGTSSFLVRSATVPDPPSIALLLVGVGALTAIRRRRITPALSNQGSEAERPSSHGR